MTCRIPAIVLFAAAIGSPLAAQEPEYSGKYAQHPPVRDALARADELRREAIENAAAKLGLTPAAAPAIVIKFSDARPADSEILTSLAGFLFFTTTTDPGGTVRIALHLEPVAAGTADLAEEVRHEMIHALMRQRAKTKESYSAIPKWLREGLAVYAAGQMEERTRWLVHSPSAETGLEALFPGLEEKDHSLDRYAEDAQAIDFIAQSKGEKSLHDLTRRLVGGEESHAAVEAVTGMKWAEFRDAAKKHALAAATKAQAKEWPTFLELREHDRKRRFAEVIAAASTFEKGHPESPLLADALYFRGKAERLGGKFDEAQETLNRALKLDPRSCRYLDEMWYQLAHSQFGAKDYEASAASFETILRDHPGLPHEDRILLRQADCVLRLKDLPRARKLLDLFDRSFPKSGAAKDAAEVRKRLDAAK